MRAIWLEEENLNRASSYLGSPGIDCETRIGCTCFIWEVQKTLEGEWRRETVKGRQPVMGVIQPAPTVGTWGLNSAEKLGDGIGHTPQ